MKVEQSTLKKVEAELGRKLPPIGSREYQDLVEELYEVRPDLARMLTIATEFDDAPDSFREQERRSANRARQEDIWHRIFYRRDDVTDEWIISKGKVTLTAMGVVLLFFIPIFFSSFSAGGNGPRLVAQVENPSPTLPPPVESINPVPEALPTLPGIEVPAAPEPIPVAVPPPPPAPPPPPPPPAPSAVQQQVAPPLVEGIDFPKTRVPSSMYASQSQRVGLSIFSSEHQATATNLYKKGNSLNSGLMASTGGSAAGGLPSGDSTSVNSLASLNLMPGMIRDATLSVGVYTVEGAQAPVVATDSQGLTWLGVSSLNESGRVWISFDRVSDGQSVRNVNAIAISDDNYPGFYANVKETTPALAADLLRSGVSGVSSYVDASLRRSRLAYVGDNVISIPQVPDLEYFIAGNMAKLFQLPQGHEAVVRVSEAPAGKGFKILVQ